MTYDNKKILEIFRLQGNGSTLSNGKMKPNIVFSMRVRAFKFKKLFGKRYLEHEFIFNNEEKRDLCYEKLLKLQGMIFAKSKISKRHITGRLKEIFRV